MCNVGGHYHRACTVVPGAVLAIPQTSPHRWDLLKQCKTEFKNTHEQQSGTPSTEVGDAGPPTKRTKKEAVDAGNRVLAGESVEKDEPYRDVDIYTTTLWYHDKIAHTMYDLAHQFGNVIKHMLTYIRNTNKKGTVKFSTDVRA